MAKALDGDVFAANHFYRSAADKQKIAAFRRSCPTNSKK